MYLLFQSFSCFLQLAIPWALQTLMQRLCKDGMIEVIHALVGVTIVTVFASTIVGIARVGQPPPTSFFNCREVTFSHPFTAPNWKRNSEKTRNPQTLQQTLTRVNFTPLLSFGRHRSRQRLSSKNCYLGARAIMCYAKTFRQSWGATRRSRIGE